MKKDVFDLNKYLKIQRSEIQKRLSMFKSKLYLEFGGKLFDDYHAARVLPGFQPDSKLQMLLGMKEKIEIVIVVNSNDIEANKVRNDTNITYEKEVERLIDAYNDAGLYVSSVVLSFYNETKANIQFINKLENNGIKVYKHYVIMGYPQDIANIVSEDGFGKNEYIETTKPIVVITAPGPGSGKLATCLSQLYHDNKRGIKSGYAKYETFPVWNLSLNNPINIAYEAATVDLADVNMIDPYHLEAYGETAVNYNRDIESFPLVNTIIRQIQGECPYKSPTDMGVNMIGFAIKDMEAANESAKKEVIRRYYQTRKNHFLGKYSLSSVSKAELLMNKLGLSIDDRPCVNTCLEKSKKTGQPVVAIQINKKKIITGKRSPLLGASAACLLNTLKYLAHIDDSIPLISERVFEPIMTLKQEMLGKKEPHLRADEILIALSIQASNNPLAELALKQLPKLKGMEAHASCILHSTDLEAFKNLGINMTEEPATYMFKLYIKLNS